MPFQCSYDLSYVMLESKRWKYSEPTPLSAYHLNNRIMNNGNYRQILNEIKKRKTGEKKDWDSWASLSYSLNFWSERAYII